MAGHDPLFEIDMPDVLAFKQRVVSERDAQSRCARAAVAADLREAWPEKLTAAGFDASQPTAWLVEGLLIYLTATEASRLLTDVSRLSAPGSRLALEAGSSTKGTAFDDARKMPAMREYTDLWRGGLGDTTPGWLADNGWSVQRHDGATLAESYGRTAPAAGRGGFLAAVFD